MKRREGFKALRARCTESQTHDALVIRISCPDDEPRSVGAVDETNRAVVAQQ